MSKEMDKKSENLKTRKELSEKTMGKVNGGRNPFGEITVQLVCRKCGAVLDEYKGVKGAMEIRDKGVKFCKACDWLDIPIRKEIEE